MSDASATYDDTAQAIGYLIMSFNDLEIALSGATMRLLQQDDKVGALLLAHLNFIARLKLLRGLRYKIKDAEDVDRFDELLEQAEAINAERNKYIHAEYSPLVNEDATVVMQTRRLRDMIKSIEGKEKHPSTPSDHFDASDVMDMANDASSLAWELLKFSERFNPGGA